MNRRNVSVVICTKDRPKMLQRCLESVLGSTEGPIEILVVDQSTDGRTAEVVEDVSAASHLPVRYLHLNSVGHTRARNVGLQACRGRIVAFTDDDCIVHPGWIGAIVREFDSPKVNCVCGQTRPADHADRPKQALLSTLNRNGRRLVNGRHNPVAIGRGNNMAFRKADLLSLGGFNEQIGVGTYLHAGDDIDMFYRLLEAGGSIIQSPGAIVDHAQPDDWQAVLRKKRGYAVSVSAVLSSRARHGDIYAGLLLAGKMLYELGCLVGGGLLRMNLQVAAIGWHSFVGSLSGLRYSCDDAFCHEVRRLTLLARNCFGGDGRQPSRQRTS